MGAELKYRIESDDASSLRFNTFKIIDIQEDIRLIRDYEGENSRYTAFLEDLRDLLLPNVIDFFAFEDILDALQEEDIDVLDVYAENYGNEWLDNAIKIVEQYNHHSDYIEYVETVLQEFIESDQPLPIGISILVETWL